MPIRGPLIGPGLRLQMGESLLVTARVVDTRLVKERLARFAQAHRSYVGAQRNVATTEQQLRAARKHLSACRTVQNEALDRLARGLIVDGHPRANPLAKFGGPSLSKVARLAFADGAKAVHRLVAAVRRSRSLSERASKAADAADEAARGVEQAIVALASVEASLRHVRRMRDAQAPGWHAAYLALGHGARAAAYDGSPGLHATLFGRPRATRKAKPSVM